MQSFGLMLHHFTDDRHVRGQGAISADELSRIIEFMGPENFLSPDEWVDRALADRLEPHHRCVTLDDALLCQYDVALPIFRRFGLTAFWFVYSSVFEGSRERLEMFRYYRTTRFPDIADFYAAFFEKLRQSDMGSEFDRRNRDFDPAGYLANYAFYSDDDRRFRFARDIVLGPDRYFSIVDDMMASDPAFDADAAASLLWMNDQHLRELSAEGHMIGLHSYSHPTALADLSPTDQRKQYEENFRHLSGVLGAPPLTMSHPVCSYSADTLVILRDMGVKVGFRDNLNAPPGASLLEMPRDDHSHIMKQMVA
jgi:peptidoglycan/xylan/chitin deacetylase (PgdA/CDA1 family)